MFPPVRFATTLKRDGRYEKTGGRRYIGQAFDQPEALPRLSVGIEDAADLIADLEQAFKTIGAGTTTADARPSSHLDAAPRHR